MANNNTLTKFRDDTISSKSSKNNSSFDNFLQNKEVNKTLYLIHKWDNGNTSKKTVVQEKCHKPLMTTHKVKCKDSSNNNSYKN